MITGHILKDRPPAALLGVVVAAIALFAAQPALAVDPINKTFSAVSP